MKTRGIWEKMTPVRKYNFLDSFLFCFVYKMFTVLYLRIRLFALLTAGKGNGTGVYAEISFPEFYNFFLFILFSFYFFFTFFYPRHLPIPTLRFLNFTFFSIYFIFILFFLYFFLPMTFTHTHTHDPRPLPTTHDPRHLATLASSKPPTNIWSWKKSEISAHTSTLLTFGAN